MNIGGDDGFLRRFRYLFFLSIFLIPIPLLLLYVHITKTSFYVALCIMLLFELVIVLGVHLYGLYNRYTQPTGVFSRTDTLKSYQNHYGFGRRGSLYLLGLDRYLRTAESLQTGGFELSTEGIYEYYVHFLITNVLNSRLVEIHDVNMDNFKLNDLGWNSLEIFINEHLNFDDFRFKRYNSTQDVLNILNDKFLVEFSERYQWVDDLISVHDLDGDCVNYVRKQLFTGSYGLNTTKDEFESKVLDDIKNKQKVV